MTTGLHISKRTAALTIIAVSVAVYANTLANGFVSDDLSTVIKNLWIRDFRNLPAVFISSAWGFESQNPSNYYRPMMYASYMIEYAAFGMRPWGYHLASILLNAAASVLVFFIIGRVLDDSVLEKDSAVCRFAAFLGGMTFALHPVHTEAVAWASCRPELLFTLFGLLSFYFYASDRAKDYLLSVFFFLLAVFSKETAVMFLPIIVAYDYCIKGRLKPGRYAAYAAVFFFYFIIRINALKGFAPDSHHTELTGYENFLNVFVLFAGYFWKLVWPANLNAWHVLHPAYSAFEFKAAAAIIFTLGYAAGLYLSRGALRFALVWAALALMPVLYIPVLGDNSFAERYLYMPSFGFALFTAVGFMRANSCGISSKAAAVFFAVVFTLYFAGTVQRNRVWANELTLWGDTVKKSPDGALPRYKYGTALLDDGRFKEAEAELAQAAAMSPGQRTIHNNLGITYARQGMWDKAEAAFKITVEKGECFADGHLNLGNLYSDTGRPSEAVSEFEKARACNPNIADVRNNLGLAYAKKGRMAEAAKEFEAAVKANPYYAKAHFNLGVMYNMAGKKDEAQKEFAEAERLKKDGGVE